ncbi:MAG TPA: group III truncated hemoglobin [Crocinitomicaceae bacterium]|nr:group III truncated hemoglobin [Crocinitomicaceae bacterium]
MKTDITTKADIDKIVFHFYEKVKVDEKIGYFFSDVMKLNWEKHTQKMSNFWENVLFYTGDYSGDPLNAHKEFHKHFPTTKGHFERWKELFNETLDEYFEGKNTEKIKEHASAIADVMVKNIDRF